jgi:hypothetical protein
LSQNSHRNVTGMSVSASSVTDPKKMPVADFRTEVRICHGNLIPRRSVTVMRPARRSGIVTETSSLADPSRECVPHGGPKLSRKPHPSQIRHGSAFSAEGEFPCRFRVPATELISRCRISNGSAPNRHCPLINRGPATKSGQPAQNLHKIVHGVRPLPSRVPGTRSL